MTGKLFGREPVLWLSAIQALLALAVGFGLDLTTEQVALIHAASAALIALVVRSQVVPLGKHEQHVDHLVSILGTTPDLPYEDEPTTPDRGAVSWSTVALVVIAVVAVLWALGELPL